MDETTTTTPELAPCPWCGCSRTQSRLMQEGRTLSCSRCGFTSPCNVDPTAAWNALAADVQKGKMAPKMAEALLTARDYMGERMDTYEMYASYPQDCSPGHKWARFSKDWEEVRAALAEYHSLTATTPTKEVVEPDDYELPCGYTLTVSERGDPFTGYIAHLWEAGNGSPLQDGMGNTTTEALAALEVTLNTESYPLPLRVWGSLSRFFPTVYAPTKEVSR